MMTDADLFRFSAAFKRLSGVFRGPNENEATGVISSYFRALKDLPLADLEAGADALIATGDRFPKPGQWRDAARSAQRHVEVLEVPVMGQTDLEVWLKAEQQCWEEPGVCPCSACRACGLDERRPPRFVPIFDRQDRVLQARIGTRTVTRGRWIHGDELAGFYLAKGECWSRLYALSRSKSMGGRRPPAKPAKSA